MQPGPVLDLEEEMATVLGTVQAMPASGQKTGPATGPVLKGNLKTAGIVGREAALFNVFLTGGWNPFGFQLPHLPRREHLSE